MAAELRDALRAGAYGFTTSRTMNHETSDDRPVASRLATWDEVRRLVGVMGDLGVGVFQFVEDPPAPEERAEREARLIALAVETGVPIAIGATSGGRALDVIDRAAEAGGRIFGLTHPRGIGNMSSFRTKLPFDTLPEWRAVRMLPLDEQRRLLADPDVRRTLVWSGHHGEYARAIGAEARKPDFERMRVLDGPVPPNPSVADLARQRGVDPVELIIDLALESDFHQFFIQTISPFDYVVVKRAMKHPRTVPTFSDAGAHVSQMADFSIHTHLLAHWVRDRGDFTLDWVDTPLPRQVCNRRIRRDGPVEDLHPLKVGLPRLGADGAAVLTMVPRPDETPANIRIGQKATLLAQGQPPYRPPFGERVERQFRAERRHVANAAWVGQPEDPPSCLRGAVDHLEGAAA